ncbi:unnamed protein product [Diamesa serratosioi]
MAITTRNNERNTQITNDNTINDILDESPIQRFYNQTNIFITGGTGFMGKILIEKLLRSCPGIDNIYLLVRPKKGKDIHTRIEETFDDPLFDKLRETIPKFRHKIVAIAGDCQNAALGLSLHDRQTLITNVNIIFHCAATLRFDENLKIAVNINVHGTKDVLELAKQMAGIKSLMYVSTAYSNCQVRNIDEMFYDFPTSVEKIEKTLCELNDEAINAITPKILENWPNTYSFTKAMAEDLVRKNKGNLPIGVFRPAVVTSTSKEPVVGWIDNLYGPTGVVAGVGTGVLRTLHCDEGINANIVPVDMAVNALITAAWDVGTNYTDTSSDLIQITEITSQINNQQIDKIEPNIPIYNYVSSVENPLSWGQFTYLNVKYGFDYPFTSAIWYRCFHMHKSAAVNNICKFLLHLIPAFLIDTIALCFGQKPRLLKTYKKIHKFSNVISFFCNNEWTFSNNNIQQLWLKLGSVDQNIFNFNMQSLNWKDYITLYIKGMRVHLFKDELSNVEAARTKWNRFYWLHQVTKLILVATLIYFIWNIVKVIF